MYYGIYNYNDARKVISYIKNMTGKVWAEDIVKDLKKELRRFFRKKAQKSDRRIVKDNGIDGYIELIELPDRLRTLEEAKEYVEEYEVMEIVPSAYDCTGRPFTSWTKTFERNNRFFAYRSVCFDV